MDNFSRNLDLLAQNPEAVNGLLFVLGLFVLLFIVSQVVFYFIMRGFRR